LSLSSGKPVQQNTLDPPRLHNSLPEKVSRSMGGVNVTEEKEEG